MFKLGKTVMTCGIANEIENRSFSEDDIRQSLARHNSGDWGDVSKEDKDLNDDALKNNDRLVSSYKVNQAEIWIITEYDRSCTTILLPEEY
jgi:hypothetical protein